MVKIQVSLLHISGAEDEGHSLGHSHKLQGSTKFLKGLVEYSKLTSLKDKQEMELDAA